MFVLFQRCCLGKYISFVTIQHIEKWNTDDTDQTDNHGFKSVIELSVG
jgi:hypothetical protein